MAELDDKVIVTKSKIVDIADAIREEMDESDTYTFPTMVEKVHTLGQGGGANKFVVIIDFSVVGEVTSNKTWQEVYDYLTDYKLNIKDIPIYLIAKDEVGSNYDSANKLFYIKASATQAGTYQDLPEYHIVFEQNNAVIPSGSSDNPNIQQYTVKWNCMTLQINTRTFEAQQKLADTNTITVSGANANLKIKTNGGLASDSNGVFVNTGLIQRALTQSNSIKITNRGNTDKIEAKIKSNEGLNSDSNGMYVDKNESLEIDSSNKLGVASELLSNIESSVMIGNASGSVASFVDGADDLPMKSCMVAIEPVQSGSGDPSPQNERPISGWTECNITKISKNFFDKTTYTNKEFISSTGVINASDNWSISDYIGIKGNTSYILSGVTNAGTVAYHCFYDKSKNFISSILSTTQNFTTPTNAYYVRLSMKTETPDSVQFELGSIATEFAQYVAPTTYNIQFPSEAGTVYGGTLDVVSGVLIVDRAIVDLGTLTWVDGGTNVFASVLNDVKVHTSGLSPYLCSNYKTINVTNQTPSDDKVVWQYYNTQTVRIKDTTYTDKDDFKEAMDGVQLVYELATPTTYNLTPTEVKTLLGINNIFADTGDVLNAEYTRDASIIINELLERVIALEQGD